MATIALALAILAFVVQILVYIAQAWTSTQQTLQSEQLNTQTRALLSEVQATARGTQAMVGDQFNAVLQAFLDADTAAIKQRGKFDPEAFERRVTSNLRREMNRLRIRQPTPAARVEVPVGATRPAATQAQQARRSSNQQAIERLNSFPDEQHGRASLERLERLSPFAVAQLAAYGEDERRSREAGTYIGLPLYVGEDQFEADTELLEAGLITALDAPPDGSSEIAHVGVLTPEGLETARLLTAYGDIPEWLSAHMKAMSGGPRPQRGSAD